MSAWALARRMPALRTLEHRGWLAGAAAAACLPDLDALAGLPHRGPTHTAGFALGVAFLACGAAAACALRKESVALSVATLLIVGSHPVLDLLTGGGPDVSLFWPFWDRAFRPVPGGLPLTGYTTAVGGLPGLLLDPWTLWAMLIEAAIFGPLFAATVIRRRRYGIGLAILGAGVWILMALAASR